jgi:hypothetical protein
VRHETFRTEIERFVHVLAAMFDDAKAAVFALRRAWITQTALADALELIGSDRTLRRLPGEDEEAYRRRLLNAFDTYQQGGTVPGMVLAMDLLGFPGAHVHEPRTPRLYDGSYAHAGNMRYGDVVWALFTVEFETTGLTAEQLEHVIRTVNRWKPAHTMLAYLVLVPGHFADDCTTADAALDLQWDYTFAQTDHYAWPVAMYDGVHAHNGSVWHDGELDPLDVEVLP